MEKLGGGGHMSIAGAQLTDCTIQQAVNTIKLTLDNMLAEARFSISLSTGKVQKRG